ADDLGDPALRIPLELSDGSSSGGELVVGLGEVAPVNLDGVDVLLRRIRPRHLQDDVGQRANGGDVAMIAEVVGDPGPSPFQGSDDSICDLAHMRECALRLAGAEDCQGEAVHRLRDEARDYESTLAGLPWACDIERPDDDGVEA